MSPLVSILIPCYNSEKWIGRTIESALAQTWNAKEVVIVDDGSTDNSLEIIKQFKSHIKWETGPNRGSYVARNRLLDLAEGEWLQYLDADDYLLPDKLTSQIDFLRTKPSCEVIFSPVAWKRVENGLVTCTETKIPEPHDPWILLARWLLPQTGGALWKKTALRQVGGWRVGQPCCQEHELYCRLLENDIQFEYCDGCYAIYNDLEHSGRITRKSGGEFERQRLLILERIEQRLDGLNRLTPARRQAVNDARHELARRIWRSDRRLALNVYQRILTSDHSFQPTVEPGSPALYLMALKLLGFRGAQIAASCARTIKRSAKLSGR